MDKPEFASRESAEIIDSSQLRSAEFKKLLAQPAVYFGLPLATIAGAIATLIIANSYLALAALAAIPLMVIAGAYLLAAQRAAEAFFNSYAATRNLQRQKMVALNSALPFLRRGDRQRVIQAFSGTMGPEVEGHLCLYTYTEEETDSDGQRHETDYKFTIFLTEVPEVSRHLGELFVRQKSGLKAFWMLEDLFLRQHQRVTLESTALNERYEIFVSKNQDPIWVRRLFSPTFIVWLSEHPLPDFSFELVNGALCCFIPKHSNSAAELDRFREISCAIVQRLREESAESAPDN